MISPFLAGYASYDNWHQETALTDDAIAAFPRPGQAALVCGVNWPAGPVLFDSPTLLLFAAAWLHQAAENVAGLSRWQVLPWDIPTVLWKLCPARVTPASRRIIRW